MKDGVAARELPTDKFHGKAAEHDDAGGLGIDPDVVFGRWRHVPFTARRPSHDHTAPDFGSEGRLFRQSEGEISKGREGYQYDSGICFDRLNYRVDCVQLSGRLMGRRIIVISESVTAMKPSRALM